MKKLLVTIMMIGMLGSGCAINSEYGRQYKMKKDAEMEVKRTNEVWQWNNRHRLDKKRREFLEQTNKKSDQMNKKRKEFAKDMHEQTKTR